jgi:hypothetical protein
MKFTGQNMLEVIPSALKVGNCM